MAVLGLAGAPARAATLAPVADAFVDSSLPSTNYGTNVKLRTDGSPIVRSYLRFDVQGWVPGSKATLRLMPTSSINTGLQVVRVADTSWGERTVTYANAPPLGAAIGTTPAPKTGVWTSLDVTSAVSGNGLLSLALASADPTAEALAGKEAGAATAPQLVIDTPVVDSTPPAPALTAPADGAVVGSATPTFTGVAGTAVGDLATVNVLIWSGSDTTAPPQVSVPAVALAAGAFSVAPLAALGEGRHTALVEQRDATGNVGRSPARSFTVDTTPPAPALTAPVAGSTTGDSTPTFAGTAGTAAGDADSASVLVWRGTDTGAAPLATLSATRDATTGAFSVDAPSALTDGLYTVRVQQTDSAGNLGLGPARAFTVDTVAPAPALTAPVAGSTTSDSTPTFAGVGGTAAGDVGTVSVLVWRGTDTSVAPTLTLGTARDATTGAFTIDAPSALTDGVYSVRVQQADGAGHTGSSPTQSFTIDTHAPPPPPPSTITLTPAADSYVDASLPATNYGTQPKLRTDGSPVVRSYLRFDVQGWAPGTSRATLRLMPTSSINTGLQVLRVADTSWGEKTITAANAPPLGPLAATTAAPKANVPLSVDVTAAIAANGPTSLALASADPTAEALASRESGANSPQLVIDHPDTTAPAPTLAGPADGALLGTGAPDFTGVAGTAAGDQSSVTVWIWDDVDTDETPLLSLPAAALAGGEYSVAPSPALADGVYTALVEQRDAAGNVGRSAPHTFTIDTQGPSPALDAPADGASLSDSTPTLSGTAGVAVGDAETVHVDLWAGTDTSGDPLTTLDAPRDGSGAFSAEPAGALDDGVYTARVRQDDAAGHSGASALRSFTVDTAAPTPTLAEPTDGATTGTTPSFGGTAGTATGDSAGVSVRIWDGGDTSGDPVLTLPATADASTGAFGVAPTDALDGGTYTARVEQDDAAGNHGAGAAVGFTVDGPDVTAPKPTLSDPGDGSSTNDTTPALAGRAGRRPGDADTVAVRVWSGSDTSVAPLVDLPAPRAPDGSFSIDVADPLAQGAYTARVEQDDAAGNHGTSANHAFTIDTQVPSPTLTDPADGSSGNDPKPAFKGSAGGAPGDSGSVTVLVWSGTNTSGDPAFTLRADAAPDGSFSVRPSDPLTPGAYTARVEQGDAAHNSGTSAAHTFTFTGVPDPTIAAAGDISCAAVSAGAACKQMATSDVLLGLNPDAVLALGDTQYENGEYANFLTQFDPSWGRLKAKIHPAVGNHEYGASVGSNAAGATCDVQIVGDPRSYACGYFDYFNGKGNVDGPAGKRGEGYYAFDVGEWRVYAINTNCDRGGRQAPSCAAGSPQEQWLRADLAAHPRQCQLMFGHHPMFTSDKREFDTPTFRALLKPLWDDFYAAGGDVVLTGHSHFYERFLPQTPDGVVDPTHGIQEIISGTGGRNVYDVDPLGTEPTSVVHNGFTFGALRFKLHSGSYDWNFVPAAGGTFSDSGTRSCHGVPPTAGG